MTDSSTQIGYDARPQKYTKSKMTNTSKVRFQKPAMQVIRDRKAVHTRRNNHTILMLGLIMTFFAQISTSSKVKVDWWKWDELTEPSQQLYKIIPSCLNKPGEDVDAHKIKTLKFGNTDYVFQGYVVNKYDNWTKLPNEWKVRWIEGYQNIPNDESGDILTKFWFYAEGVDSTEPKDAAQVQRMMPASAPPAAVRKAQDPPRSHRRHTSAADPVAPKQAPRAKRVKQKCSQNNAASEAQAKADRAAAMMVPKQPNAPKLPVFGISGIWKPPVPQSETPQDTVLAEMMSKDEDHRRQVQRIRSRDSNQRVASVEPIQAPASPTEDGPPNPDGVLSTRVDQADGLCPLCGKTPCTATCVWKRNC